MRRPLNGLLFVVSISNLFYSFIFPEALDDPPVNNHVPRFGIGREFEVKINFA
jgi:hypothetical protein